MNPDSPFLELQLDATNGAQIVYLEWLQVTLLIIMFLKIYSYYFYLCVGVYGNVCRVFVCCVFVCA